MDLPTLCEKIDQLVLKYFQLLEDIADRRNHLAQLLQQGHLCLSKAKYSMGCRAVSPLQYDTNMKALALIQVKGENGTKCFSSTRKESSKTKSVESVKSAYKEVDSRDHASEVRNRKDVSNKDFLSNRIEELTLSPEEEQPLKDPLNWFGVLVPAPLRQSQGSFKSAIDDVAQIATLQNELIAVKAEYEELLRMKEALAKQQTQ